MITSVVTWKSRPRWLLTAVVVLMLGIGFAGLVTAPPAAAQTTVTTEAALRAAFADPAETEIVLGADIEVTSCPDEAAAGLVGSGEIDRRLIGRGHSIFHYCTGLPIIHVGSGDGSLTVEDTLLHGGEQYTVTVDGSGEPVPSPGGGAIHSLADVTVIGSTFFYNLSWFEGHPGNLGGAIYSSRNVTVIDSTFTDNQAGDGGAIYAEGSISATNSTFERSMATRRGGALSAGGDVSLVHSTFLRNGAYEEGTDVDIRPGGTLEAFGTVLDGGSGAPSCSAGVTTVSSGYNYPAGGCPGLDHPTDLPATPDPVLGPLEDNGGPARTAHPKPGSPLIDAIPEKDCRANVATDQRGISRPQGPGCDVGAVEVEVDNKPPVAADQQLSSDQDTPLTVTLSATDPDGNDLVFAIDAEPQHGTLSGAGEVVTYTPTADYVGEDSFTFTVTDEHGDVDTGTISITVNPVDGNTPPVAEDIEVDAEEARPVEVLIRATDPDGDELTYTVTGGPDHGVVTGTGPRFGYTAEAGFSGTDAFAVEVCDPDGGCDAANVTVEVAAFAPPSAPPIKAGTLTVDPATAWVGDVVAVGGRGFEPGETVFLVLYSEPSDPIAVAADDEGGLTATITVPDGTVLGDHTVVAFGSNQTLAGGLVVIADDDGGSDSDDGTDADDQADPDDQAESDDQAGSGAGTDSEGGGELPNTGTTTEPLLGVAAFLLLAAGTGILTARRRPRRSAASLQ